MQQHMTPVYKKKTIIKWVVIVGIIVFIFWNLRKVSNLDSCPACPVGTTAQNDGSCTCKTTSTPVSTNLCPVGSFSSSGQEPCMECSTGFTTKQPGSTVCIKNNIPCGIDTYSSSGMIPCIRCETGTYTEYLGSTICIKSDIPKTPPCPKGYVSVSGRDPLCTPCPDGQTTATIGSMFCSTIGV
jgi:hypothetical protein